jgi:hypothetical protein
MSDKIIDDLATQVANYYKSGGRYTLYGSVAPRSFKEGTDPAQSSGRTSTCCINIFDSESKTGVLAYMDPIDPKYVLEKIKTNIAKAVGNETASYYKTQCVMGLYKGKSVAEFVLNSSEDDIKAEYTRLKQTSEQYPRNKQIAEAVYEAVAAKRDGILKAVTTEVILDEIKTPNNKKVDGNGNTECRTLTIKYTSVFEEPYEITIKNFKAPPAKGNVGAIFSKAVDIKHLSMSLSEKEMYELFAEFVEAKDMYSRASESRRIKYADSKAWKPTNQYQSMPTSA